MDDTSLIPAPHSAWRVLINALLIRSFARLVAIVVVAVLLIVMVAQVPIGTLVIWAGGPDAASHTFAGASRRIIALAKPSAVPRILIFGGSHFREAITTPVDLAQRVKSLVDRPVDMEVFPVAGLSAAQIASMLTWVEPDSGGMVVVFASGYALWEDRKAALQIRQRWPVAFASDEWMEAGAGRCSHETLGNLMPCWQMLTRRSASFVRRLLDYPEQDVLHVTTDVSEKIRRMRKTASIAVPAFADEFGPLATAISRLRAGRLPWRVIIVSGVRREEQADATPQRAAFDLLLANWCNSNGATLWTNAGREFGLVTADFYDQMHIDNDYARDPFTAKLAARIAEEFK
jgi:hypothetical protein